MLHIQTNAVIQRTKINVASTTQQTIATALAGNKATLLSIMLTVAGIPDVITFQSNNTALAGAMTITPSSPLAISTEKYGILSTAVGEGLKFTIGGGSQVSGVATWIYETV